MSETAMITRQLDRFDNVLSRLDTIADRLDRLHTSLDTKPTRTGIYTPAGAARVLAYAGALCGVSLLLNFMVVAVG